MRKVGFAMLLVVGCVVAAFAQARRLTDSPGRWKKWSFTAYAGTRTHFGAKPADVKAFEAQLLRLNDIIKNTDGITKPVGFSAETSGVLGMGADRATPFRGEPKFTAQPLAGILNFGAFPIWEYGSGASAKRDDGGETALLLFFVNDVSIPLFASSDRRVPEFEKLETDVVLLAKPEPDLFGLPRYGETIIIKKTDAPIWTAVNMGEVVELVARSIEQRLADQRDTVARLQASYDDRTDPAKRARRMDEYRQIARHNPDKTFMDQMAKVDEELANTAAQLLPHIAREKANAKLIEKELAEAKAAAGRLSAAEKKAAACYATGASGQALSRFRRAPQSGCEPLVRPNWALFNPKLPRSAPQFLGILHFTRCLPPYQPAVNPGGCKTNLHLLENIDKAALQAWLK